MLTCDPANVCSDDLEVYIADELELDFPWAEEPSFESSYSTESENSHHDSSEDVGLDTIAQDLSCFALDDSDGGGRDEEDRVDPREIERPRAPLFNGNTDIGEEDDEEDFGERESSRPDIWMDNVPYIDDAEFEMMVCGGKDEGRCLVIIVWEVRLGRKADILLEDLDQPSNQHHPSGKETITSLKRSNGDDVVMADDPLDLEALLQKVAYGRYNVEILFIPFRKEWKDAYERISKQSSRLFYNPQVLLDIDSSTFKPHSGNDVLEKSTRKRGKRKEGLRVRLLSNSLQNRALEEGHKTYPPSFLTSPANTVRAVEKVHTARPVSGHELKILESLYDLDRL
ncbi:9896_t:CDS:2 [Acaulospora colombiana]|uniref:9896_t:CDS:1 n=1 Tax=Acaulospora colombiana TaxID=27376 RepID=A0ACA9MCQ0_9GLOM|nr:9896_t:CDS:2 [Acaulospora colombiana]